MATFVLLLDLATKAIGSTAGAVLGQFLSGGSSARVISASLTQAAGAYGFS